MFRLFTFVALTGLTAALAANAQDPAPMAKTGSSDKAVTLPAPAGPTVVVIATVSVKGEQLKKYVPDPLEPTKNKEEIDPFYTYRLKNGVVLAEKITVQKGAMLLTPEFVKGQAAPKQVPAVKEADGVRRLQVPTKIDEILTVEDDELVLEPGTKLAAMTYLKLSVPKFDVVAPPTIEPLVKLPTGAVVPESYPTDGKNATEQFGKLTQDVDQLKAAVAKTPAPVIMKVDPSQEEFDAKLKSSPYLTKALADNKKETLEAVKKELDAREKKLNERLNELTGSIKGKADQKQLDEVRLVMTALGSVHDQRATLEKMRENADKVPGLETRVADLAKKPAPVVVTPPTVTSKTTITRCFNGPPQSFIVEGGRRYVYVGNVVGYANMYFYREE